MPDRRPSTGHAALLAVLVEELLEVQAETGDPGSQARVNAAVELLAHRLVDLVGEGVPPARRAGPPPLADVAAVASGEPASCSAAAAALRRIAPRVPQAAGSRVRDDLLSLGDALQEHAQRLAELRTLRRRAAPTDRVRSANGRAQAALSRAADGVLGTTVAP